MKLNLTQQAIERYEAAFQAEEYQLRLVNEDTQVAIPMTYSASTLVATKTVNFLRLKNSEGSNIYIRPSGLQYVLLDDLTIDALAQIKADDLRLCAIVETSPSNFQGWLILPTCPASREEAKRICRLVAQLYGADPGSAEPDHLGRLPGFTNRKPKHRKANGQFPYVILHKAQHRLSTFSTPLGGAVSNTTLQNELLPVGKWARPTETVYTQNHSHSEHDFGIVVGLIKQGWDDDRIAAHLRVHSPDLLVRKKRQLEKYILRTINNARKLYR